MLFRKIEPRPSWSEISHLAWSVITNDALAEAETSAHTSARSWLNAEIQSCAARVGETSKIRGIKDENNNLITLLAMSKSPSISRLSVYR